MSHALPVCHWPTPALAQETCDHPPHVRSLIDVPILIRKRVPLGQTPVFDGPLADLPFGSIVLAAGAPGSNKSTLALQSAADLAAQGHRILLILTEEGVERAKTRLAMMIADQPPDIARTIMGNIQYDDGVTDVAMLPDLLVRQVLSPTGRFHGISMIVLDSIQGPGLAASSTRAYGQVVGFLSLARDANLLVIAVCHVTKRGEIAGPKMLEHAVDCSILIRKAHTRRLVSVLKNRFGPESARPIQLELDPTTLRLRPSPHAEIQTAIARGYLPGFGLSEVQAAVSLPRPGLTAKVTAPGLHRKEIDQIVAGLCQVPGFELADFDLSIQCRLPGDRLYRTVLGLPLAIALASSYIQQPIPERHIYLGEIDLGRAVRDVSPGLLADLSNAIASGAIPLPIRILCPPSAVVQLPSGSGVDVVPCQTLDQAILATWPSLR